MFTNQQTSHLFRHVIFVFGKITTVILFQLALVFTVGACKWAYYKAYECSWSPLFCFQHPATSEAHFSISVPTKPASAHLILSENTNINRMHHHVVLNQQFADRIAFYCKIDFFFPLLTGVQILQGHRSWGDLYFLHAGCFQIWISCVCCFLSMQPQTSLWTWCHLKTINSKEFKIK